MTTQIEQRLEKLERSNRVLRLLLAALASAAIAACTVLEAAPGSTDTLRTRLLQIVDENDKVIAELGSDGLLIRDDQSRVRISLHHNVEETGLYLRDEAGDSRVGVVHFAHGGSGVALHGPDVRGAAVMYYKKSGSLSFYAPDGAVQHRIPAN